MTEYASRTDLEALSRSGRGKFVLLAVLLAAALGAAAWSFLRKTGVGNPEEASKVLVVSRGTTVGYGNVLRDGGFEAGENTMSYWTNKAKDELPELEVDGIAAIMQLADQFGWGYVAFEAPADLDFSGLDIDGGTPTFAPDTKWAVVSAGDFAFDHVVTVNPAPSKVLRDPALPLLQALFEQEHLKALREPDSLSVTELQLRDRLKDAIARVDQVPEAELMAAKIVDQVREQLVDKERGDPKPLLVGEPLESTNVVALPDGQIFSSARSFELVTRDAVRADLDLGDERRFLAAAPNADADQRVACESFAGGHVSVADGGAMTWAQDGGAVVLETLAEGEVLWTFAAAEPGAASACTFRRAGTLAPARSGLLGRPVPHRSGKVARVGQSGGFGVVAVETPGQGEPVQLALLEGHRVGDVEWIDEDRLVALAESEIDSSVWIVLLSVKDPMRVLVLSSMAVDGADGLAAVVPVPGRTSLLAATAWGGRLYRVDLPGTWDALFEQPPMREGVAPVVAEGRPTVYEIDASKATAQAMQTKGNVRSPVVSADGRWVAFTVSGEGIDEDAAHDDEIAVSEIATGRTKLLTRNALEDRSPAITPDGKHVVFETEFEIPKTEWRITAGRIVPVGD
jgi:hypothetical protein